MLVQFATEAAENNYLYEGIKLFDKKEFKKSKNLFEKDIVFNPKSEKSYLYLAKIFKNNKNEDEEKINLSNVLLLNPNNEEAIYLLALLKIKKSNYKEAKELMDKFVLVCQSECDKESEIQDSLKKITPEDVKIKN